MQRPVICLLSLSICEHILSHQGIRCSHYISMALISVEELVRNLINVFAVRIKLFIS